MGKTFAEADLRQGDILLIEETANDEVSRCVSDYFVDLMSWRQVDVKPVNPQQCQKTCENIKIHLKWNLKELLMRIGEHLEIDWEHLRVAFTSDSNCVDASEASKTTAHPFNVKFLKSDSEGTVKDFLTGTTALDTITIKYEITREPARTAENQSRYFIEAPSNATSPLGEILPQAIYLTPFVSTVTDLINEIAKIFQLENVDPKRFRLLECQGGKIKKTYDSRNESLTPINTEKSTLYLEEIEGGTVDTAVTATVTNANANANTNVKYPNLISCFTFEKNPMKPFGIPFKFEIKSGEPVKKLKTRLALKLATPSDTLTLFLFSGQRDRKLDDPAEILSKLPPGKFGDDDQLAIQMSDPRKQRSNSGFDGAIRFRK